MSKQDVLIKPTRDGRFWSMGLVVDTVDEALDRCQRKAPDKLIHVEWPSEPFTDELSGNAGVCGTSEYVRLWLCA